MLLGQTLTMAPLLPSVVAELGPLELAEFSLHLTMLAFYTAAAKLDTAELEEEGGTSKEDFRRACQRDAWLYGSGLD